MVQKIMRYLPRKRQLGSNLNTVWFAIYFLFITSPAGASFRQASTNTLPTPLIRVGEITTCKKKIRELHQALTCKEATATTEELTLVSDATIDLNKVIGSSEFREAVLAAKFQETNGKTNQEIYDLIVNSSPIQIDITLYTGGYVLNHWAENQGFEDENAPNVCFGNRFAIQGRRGFLGSLMLHETMHILGFYHYDDPVGESVPYTMNTIYDSVAQKLRLSTSYTNAEVYP